MRTKAACFFLSLFLFFTINQAANFRCKPNDDQINTQDNIVISKFCELVHQRSYLISRLENPIRLLKRSYKAKQNLTIDKDSFKHPIIVQKLRAIQKQQNLTPLFDLWESLQSLQYLNDPNFAREFARLVLATQRALALSNLQNKQYCHKELLDSDILLSLSGTTYTESNTIRYYYAHRLTKHIHMLQSIRCNKDRFFEDTSECCNCTFVSQYTFTHPEIKRCIKQMEKRNTLAPLIDLFHSFSKLKLIQDNLFLKEFLLLVLTAYRNLVINNANKKGVTIKKSTLDTVALLYENIDHLPLEQILDVIDLLADELPPLIEKYEFMSDIKWKAWLKKYWWVPPFIFGMFTLKIALIFKKYIQPNAATATITDLENPPVKET